MNDPLESLAAVPEVMETRDTLTGWLDCPCQSSGRHRADCIAIADLDRYTIAVRDAVLAAVADQLEHHGEGKRGWPVGAVRYAADLVRQMKREVV